MLGLSAPDPDQGDDLPGPTLAEIKRYVETAWFPLLLGRESKAAAIVLLARPLKAANPDALHPGKARE